MNEISIFKGIDEQNVKSMLKCFEAKTIVYKKDTTVISNLANTNIIGIIIDGTANLVKSDYDGNRVILEKLDKGSIFGEVLLHILMNYLLLQQVLVLLLHLIMIILLRDVKNLVHIIMMLLTICFSCLLKKL